MKEMKRSQKREGEEIEESLTFQREQLTTKQGIDDTDDYLDHSSRTLTGAPTKVRVICMEGRPTHEHFRIIE